MFKIIIGTGDNETCRPSGDIRFAPVTEVACKCCKHTGKRATQTVNSKEADKLMLKSDFKANRIILSVTYLEIINSS